MDVRLVLVVYLAEEDMVLTVHVLGVKLVLTVLVVEVELVLTERAVKVGLVLNLYVAGVWLTEHVVEMEVKVHVVGVRLLT